MVEQITLVANVTGSDRAASQLLIFLNHKNQEIENIFSSNVLPDKGYGPGALKKHFKDSTQVERFKLKKFFCKP